jgi:multiple sugar transport system substrate-binding protein
MRKNAFLFISLLICILLFEGCSVNGSDAEKKENTIKLYLMSKTKEFMTKASKDFNARYPDYFLDIEYFDSLEKYRKKLNTELLAGRGPDVVLFDANTFNSLYKMVKSGVFCDINPLIEDDRSFNAGNYNKIVMDCGVFDGKRYIIPLDYRLNAFITSEELLRENGISMDSRDYDMNTLASALRGFLKRDENNRAEFFFTMPYSFHEYVLSSGLYSIDYEKPEADFDTPEFRKLLNEYRNVFVKVSADYEARSKYGFRYWEIMKGNTAIASSDIYTVQSVWLANSFINGIFKTEGRVYSLPPYGKNAGYTAEPYEMVAINNISKNKAIAFDIVKFMLTKDLQMRDNGFIPVNEEAYEEMIKKYAGEEGKNQSLNINGTHLDSVALSENTAGDLRNIKAGMSKCIITDDYINKVMNDAAQKFIDGEYSEDQVINEINNKIMLYLNE